MNAYPTNQYQRSTSSPRMLCQQLVRTTGHMVFEAPAASAMTIDAIWLANGNTAAVTVRLHHLSPSATASQANALVYDMAVPATSTVVLDGPIVMSAGDLLWASCSVASQLALTAYGRAGA